MRDIQAALSPERTALFFKETDNLVERRNLLLAEVAYLKSLKYEIAKQFIVCDGLNQQINSYIRLISNLEREIDQKKHRQRLFLCALLVGTFVAVVLATCFW